jgi:hypothetical protein
MNAHPIRSYSLYAFTLLAMTLALPAIAAVNTNGFKFGDTKTKEVKPAPTGIVVEGFKFDDMNKVGGKDLKLNGAGMRSKLIVEVYAAGLFLTEKKTTAAEIFASEGPRRVTLMMARDVSSDDFGSAFMLGIQQNSNVAQLNAMAQQIGKFGEMFAGVPGLKKNDILHIDWLPGVGTQAELNGRKMLAPVPDIAFYNAILRIWLGDKPADLSLKAALLGNKCETGFVANTMSARSALKCWGNR